MIQLNSGLKNSLLVLEHLRDKTDLKDIDVSVGTFTNCRECGLTFFVREEDRDFTWCVYEHRNSDDIIINGKNGDNSMCGGLPYKSDSKSDYLELFKYNEHMKCADKLAEMIIDFCGGVK